ncbi:hypothetical protein [Bythopirellula goksoeyrii]|uniref:hypothetical protein n=1 Tax=Bythopirellula goksoeyrii TaxID=1400387 RepID=UPI0011CDE53A|nr:hypothetical protein [Bythopirellula goksoeyrii]
MIELPLPEQLEQAGSAKVACETLDAHEEQGAQLEQAEQGAGALQAEQLLVTTGLPTITGRISTWRWPRGANAVT